MRTMAVRFTRVIVGVLLVLVSYPAVLASGGLWLAAGHRDATGAYHAVTQELRTDGYALVVDDIDALLREDMPLARGGQTELRLSVVGPGGPLFLGLGPHAAVRRYLAGSSHTRIDRVRPAMGRWPVDLTESAGPATPTGLPFGQDFWVAASTGLTRNGIVEDALRWTPAAVRGQRLGLVIMNADASPGIEVHVAAAVHPQWLAPMAWGLTAVGVILLLLGIALIAWPLSPRKTVYLIDGEGLPALVNRLGLEQQAGRETAGDEPASGHSGEDAADTPPDTPDHEKDDGASAVRAGRPAAVNGAVRNLSPWSPVTTVPTRRAEPRTWSALLASARPPATPRLLWPPKRADIATVPPKPVAPAQPAAESASRTEGHTSSQGFQAVESNAVGVLD